MTFTTIKPMLPKAEPKPTVPVDLPSTDVLRKILSNLDAKDAFQAAKAHPALYRAAKDPELWSEIAGKAPRMPAVMDPKTVADLRSGPVIRAIKKGAEGAVLGLEVALLTVPDFLSGGHVLRLAASVETQRKAERESRNKIAAQARQDTALLLPRLRALGIESSALSPVDLPKNVKQLRDTAKQQRQLETALNRQLLRCDWVRALKIIETLGPDAALSLDSKQLNTVARKAAVEGEMEFTRWLVGRGAKLSKKFLDKCANDPKISLGNGAHHFVAMGAIPLHRHVTAAFHVDMVPSRKDMLLNGALMDENFAPVLVDDPKTWPRKILDVIGPAFTQAQTGDPAGLSAVMSIVLSKSQMLSLRTSASGDALKDMRRDLAIYQEVLRRSLEAAKQSIVKTSQTSAAALDDDRPKYPVDATGIQGKFLAPDARMRTLQALEDAAKVVEARAFTLATRKLVAPLRDLHIARVHEHAQNSEWSSMMTFVDAGLPTDVLDAQGTPLAQKVQNKFNQLVTDQHIHEAVMMKLSVTSMASATPVQARLDLALHKALDAEDFKMCKQLLTLGCDLHAFAPGQLFSARTRIVEIMKKAIQTANTDALEQLLGLLPSAAGLSWENIAKRAFAGTFLRRRYPGTTFTPNLVQKRVMQALNDAIVAASWTAALDFVHCGVPLSLGAQTELDKALYTALRQRRWSDMAKISKLKMLASTP